MDARSKNSLIFKFVARTFIFVSILFFLATVFASYDYVSNKNYIESVLDVWILAIGYLLCIVGYTLTRLAGKFFNRFE